MNTTFKAIFRNYHTSITLLENTSRILEMCVDAQRISTLIVRSVNNIDYVVLSKCV